MFGPIVEPENCAGTIGEVDTTTCNPKVAAGQVGRVFITLLDGNEDFGIYDTSDPLAADAVNNPEAWTDRIDQTGQSTGAIIVLHGIGEKPEPEDEEIDLPLGGKKILSRTHTLPFSVYQVSDKINERMRHWAAFGGTVGLWYETRQPILCGSGAQMNKPIRASIKVSPVIARDIAGGHLWNMVFTWKDVKVETMMDSPVPDTPEAGAGSGS